MGFIFLVADSRGEETFVPDGTVDGKAIGAEYARILKVAPSTPASYSGATERHPSPTFGPSSAGP
jgi:hypothetical protein